MDDSTSMLWARVIRGISSSANAVTPRDAISRTVCGVPSGSAMAIRTWPDRIDANSPARTCSTMSAAKTSARLSAICAPLSWYALSGNPARSPAPRSIVTSRPAFFSGAIDAGTSATRCSAGNCSVRTPIRITNSMIRSHQPVHLTIALAQLNPTVGDIDGNLDRIRRARDRSAAGGADLVVLPELALIGYPPEDLVLRPSVVEACHAAIDCLVRESHSFPALIATTPWREDGRLYNAAIVIDKGTTERRFKSDLPNYGVFDEKRVFTPGPLPEPVNFRGTMLGVPVCEDIWTPAVTAHLARAGAEFFIVPNGSPFETGKFPTRIELARARARETNRALVYVNQIGGQDELVFDGRSFVLNSSGDLACSLPGWEETVEITRWTRASDGWRCEPGRA